MAKSKKTGKLPKRIGGIKLPKAVRRSGKTLSGSPFMREILASALVAAGAALLKNDAFRKRAKNAKAKAGKAARYGATLAADAGEKARDMLVKRDRTSGSNGAAKRKTRPATA